MYSNLRLFCLDLLDILLMHFYGSKNWVGEKEKHLKQL